MPEQFDQAFWDDRYRSRTALWSGKPNPHLVTEAENLVPGTALDVGSGEGADAIWLAQQGWMVTAVDISAVALERAAGHASEAGADIAGRIEWLHQDLTVWEPPQDHYDLVSAQFMQLPPAPRTALFDRLAHTVAPGGTLLIVGHHPSDMGTTMPRPRMPELYFTGEDIVGQLDQSRWSIVTNASAERTATHPDGHPITIHDTVLRALRT